MAPPKKQQAWMDALFQIYLPHYGPTSRSYAPSTQGTDYGGVSEAAEALAHAECRQIVLAQKLFNSRIPSKYATMVSDTYLLQGDAATLVCY